MQAQVITDRSRLRMERLKQLELEQLQWEQEALVMPEALNRALFLSFESVKTEFSDLDGLSWSRYRVPLVTNPWAFEEPTPKPTCTEIGEFPKTPDTYDNRTPSDSLMYPCHQPPLPRPKNPLPYAVSSRTELASLAPEDTIRASRLSRSSWGSLQPANQFCGVSHMHPHTHGPGLSHAVPRSYSPANIAIACHSPRRPTYGFDSSRSQ